MNWLRLNDAFHNKIAILVLVTYISMDYFAKKIEFGCMKKINSEIQKICKIFREFVHDTMLLMLNYCQVYVELYGKVRSFVRS